MTRLRRRRGFAAPLAIALSGVAVLAAGSGAAAGRGGHARGGGDASATATASPIKHVIVIIGENHTFDNVYGTYQPPRGQRIMNLLSEGIVNANGDPGPNVGKATQNTATDTTEYQLDPTRTGAYATLPQPDTTYVSQACDGQTGNTPDARFPTNLANAPYQITKYVPYFDDHGQYNKFGTCEFNGAYVGDPLHRFYQMYQEVSSNKNDLWTWVHQTAGDSNGAPPSNPHQGALDMGFYNMPRATPRPSTTLPATTPCRTTITRR
jgi:phospholipase C